MKWFDFHTHTKNKPDSLFNIILNNDEQAPESGFFSVGLHPWFELKKEDLLRVEELLTNERCLAVGETGLDRVRNENFDQQVEFFEAHLNLAEKYGKPVILHCVKAYQDILERLLKRRISTPVIFHDYNGGEETTRRLLKELNLYFSYGDKLFRNNSKGMGSLKLIPLERILIETDDSNHKISEAGEKLAKLKKCPSGDVSTVCFANSKEILKI